MANCPYCRAYFAKKELAVEHINKYHAQQLESDNMDAPQSLYYSTHGTLNGHCMCGCNNPTEWNYQTGKPHKVSSDPKCRERLRALANKNMIKEYGTTTLLNDMEHQRKMQKNRPTSGEYIFEDGGRVSFLSKPEEAFLKFCDQIMEIKSWGIQVSPETFSYWDPQSQKKRQYDPDFYLPDYNLLVEIKDGGKHTNTNPEFIKETKYKVALKDAVMKKQTKYNFIKITDNNFGPFVELLYQIVHKQGPEDYKKPTKTLVVITEAACTDLDDQMDFCSVTETFHEMYAVMTSRAGLPIAFGLSESAQCYRIYQYDYLSNSLCETVVDQNPEEDYHLDVYKFIGDKDTLDRFMKQHIEQCMSEVSSAICNPIYAMLSEGIHFYSEIDRNNNSRKMDFIKVGEYDVHAV